MNFEEFKTKYELTGWTLTVWTVKYELSIVFLTNSFLCNLDLLTKIKKSWSINAFYVKSIFDCPGGEIGKARQLRSKETTLCIIRPICNDMQSTKTHLSHRAARRRRRAASRLRTACPSAHHVHQYIAKADRPAGTALLCTGQLASRRRNKQ